jgi:hypothetical protein
MEFYFTRDDSYPFPVEYYNQRQTDLETQNADPIQVVVELNFDMNQIVSITYCDDNPSE